MPQTMLTLFKGVFILMLALAMWSITHNRGAWLVFFVPGSVYTLYGMYRVFVKGEWQ